MNGQDKLPGATDEERIANRASELFDDSVQSLDAATRSRLNQGRQKALDVAGKRAVGWSVWMPVSAAAAVATVTFVMWNGVEQPDTFSEPTMVSDLEILMDQEFEQDDLEMLEDLEFYSWIDLDDELSIDDQDIPTVQDEHVG